MWTGDNVTVTSQILIVMSVDGEEIPGQAFEEIILF